MKLTGLRLQNVACFEDIELHFGGDRHPSPWVVILGENGTGKSTVLRMIGAALMGPNNLATIAAGINWKAYVRNSPEIDTGRISLSLRSDPEDNGFKGTSTVYVPDVLLGERLGPFGGNIGFTVDGLDSLYSDDLTAGWFSCGYSPWRRSARRTEGGAGAFPTLRDSDKAYRFSTLFGDESTLTSASDWLSGLYFRSIHPQRSDTDIERFEGAIAALQKTLPDLRFDSVTPDREVLFVEAGTSVPLERLSDGYRSTLSWVTDLIRRLFDAFPKDPLNASGVVLIDEIDLHLHPRWQREVVERTRKLFPNLQFIVTTHSPFVAQDMAADDTVIVLKRQSRIGAKRNEPHPVVAEQGSGFAQGWRADQILTSYLFGLEGTRNQSVLKDEREYENLLDAEANGTLTERRKRRLEKLRRDLDRVMSAPGETVDQQEVYAAANDVIEALSGVRVPSREEVANLTDDDNLFL